jgi:competence protein ComEC
MIIHTLLFLSHLVINQTEKLSLTVADVGHGDAILLELPDNKVALIDAGNGLNFALYDEAYFKRPLDLLQNVDTIDYLILTHPHEDHFGGMFEVISQIPIKNFYYPISNDSILIDSVMRELKSYNANLHCAMKGDTICKNHSYNLAVLHPDKLRANDNLNSIVLRIVYKDISFLLTGDIDSTIENTLLESYDRKDLNSDVLKITHHGSQSGSHFEFIRRINPQIAIISTAKEIHHPSIRVIGRLIAFGTKVFRTDTRGDITVTTDGYTVTVSTQKERINDN